MAVHPLYARGYTAGLDAGYKKGLREGLSGSTAKLIMERDLIFCYGVLAICLAENHHWKQESIERLITEIQTKWDNLEKERKDGTVETMAELVERKTGIALEQPVQNILNAGWNNE